MKTRAQAILAAIATEEGADWAAMESRAESLPTMVLRHGVLPVKVFLKSKDDSDRALWALVERGIKAVLREVPTDEKQLAALPFEEYLLLNEVAAEAAALVARWVKVRKSERVA